MVQSSFLRLGAEFSAALAPCLHPQRGKQTLTAHTERVYVHPTHAYTFLYVARRNCTLQHTLSHAHKCIITKFKNYRLRQRGFCLLLSYSIWGVNRYCAPESSFSRGRRSAFPQLSELRGNFCVRACNFLQALFCFSLTTYTFC